jgi:ABC-type glutathione transport system ATPase component
MSISTPLLSVKDIRISFPSAQNFEAVKGISFELTKGKTLAVVGESGSGKSLIALTMMGLQPKESIVKAELHVQYEGNTIALDKLSPTEWQKYRGGIFGMIFQ